MSSSPLRAGVAESVDAPDSKSGSGNRVRVQVSPPAPNSKPLFFYTAAMTGWLYPLHWGERFVKPD